MAVRALNVEVTGVRDAVRDTHTGLIRLQFWKDGITAMESGKKVPNHPILLQLCKHRSVLDFQLVIDLIESKTVFFNDQPFKTVQDVEDYSKDSFSSINVLLLKALANSQSDSNLSGHARHCAHQLGLAEGMTTLLRGLPHNANNRRLYLPTDLMLTHKVSTESVVRGLKSPEFLRVVEALAARADEHLTNCRFRQACFFVHILRHFSSNKPDFRAKYLNREEKLLFLPAVSVDNYLSRLLKVECDVFHPSLQHKDSLLPLKLYIKKLSRQF